MTNKIKLRSEPATPECTGIDGACNEPGIYTVVNGSEVDHYCMECLLDNLRDVIENNDDLTLMKTDNTITHL